MAKNDTVEPITRDTVESSRRTFLKKGALATGALALGISSTTTAAAQNDNDALVFTDDYVPNTRFRVTGQLPASITVRLLRRPSGGTVPEISQPDDYIGYVVRYQGSGNRPGDTTFVFTRRALREGRRYRLSTDSQVFSSDLNLLSARISRSN